MKLLSGKTRVDNSDANFPLGKIKDETGSNDGTPANFELVNDTYQFLARIFELSGLAANGAPDQLGAYQLVEALQKIMIQKVAATPNQITQVIEIGDWDMDADVRLLIDLSALTVPIVKTSIRQIYVMIRPDDDASASILNGGVYPLDMFDSENDAKPHGGWGTFDFNGVVDELQLQRTSSQLFDSTNFNKTSFNRGFVYITYEA